LCKLEGGHHNYGIVRKREETTERVWIRDLNFIYPSPLENRARQTHNLLLLQGDKKPGLKRGGVGVIVDIASRGFIEHFLYKHVVEKDQNSEA